MFGTRTDGAVGMKRYRPEVRCNAFFDRGFRKDDP